MTLIKSLIVIVIDDLKELIVIVLHDLDKEFNRHSHR